MRTYPISVVLPVRNGASYVRKAVESIGAQTIRPYELVVVDDGSTDGTREALARADAGGIPVRLVEGPARGISAAHNAAVRAATSPWIAVMHADDIALPHRLERQWAAAQAHPEVLLWGTFAYHLSPDGRVLGLSESGCTSLEAYRAARAEGALTGNVIHATAFFRRDTFEAAGGYDEAFDVAEDLDLFERMAALGPVLALAEPLLHRRIHRSSISMQRHRRMQRHVRWIAARTRALHRGDAWDLRPGKPPPSDARLLRRLATRAEDLRVYCYHAAAVRYAEGEWLRAAAALGVATLLGPHYVVPRLMRQLVPVLGWRGAAHSGEMPPGDAQTRSRQPARHDEPARHGALAPGHVAAGERLPPRAARRHTQP